MWKWSKEYASNKQVLFDLIGYIVSDIFVFLRVNVEHWIVVKHTSDQHCDTRQFVFIPRFYMVWYAAICWNDTYVMLKKWWLEHSIGISVW